MIRYSLFVLAIVGSAATAIASIGPAAPVVNEKNVTVIAKNQAWPVYEPIQVAECELEDCSDIAEE